MSENVSNYKNCQSLTFITNLLQLEDKRVAYIIPEIPPSFEIIPKQKNPPS